MVKTWLREVEVSELKHLASSITSGAATMLCLTALELELLEALTVSALYTLPLIVSSKYSIKIYRNISINTGALSPIIMSLIQAALLTKFISLHTYLTLIAISSIITWTSSSYIEGVGVGAHLLVPTLAASSISAISVELLKIKPILSAPIAYSVSTLSVLVSVDIVAATPFYLRSRRVEVGGRGPLDLLTLSPTLSSLLSIALACLQHGI